MIDLQVNGAAGHDLTSEPERLWDVGAALAGHGVTAFLPTVVTSDPEVPARALAVLAAGPPPGWRGAEPLGLHLEGPFLASGRRGAHAAPWLRDPSVELAAGWSREAGVAMVTLAPELPGALPLIAELCARGVVVSIGHTEATAEQVEAAVAAGARCFTHLGNAMPPMLAREPGPVAVAFADPSTVAGIVVDGHHLAPWFVRAAWEALGPDRLVLVSDTTAALGLPDGPVRLGDQDVFLADGAVRLADGTLAGSAAALPDCVARLAEIVNVPVADVMPCVTSTPRRLLGLEG